MWTSFLTCLTSSPTTNLLLWSCSRTPTLPLERFYLAVKTQEQPSSWEREVNMSSLMVCGRIAWSLFSIGNDEEHLSHGVYDTYTTTNLRYSQVAPLTMFTETNTCTNLPAQIDIFATKGDEVFKNNNSNSQFYNLCTNSNSCSIISSLLPRVEVLQTRHFCFNKLRLSLTLKASSSSLMVFLSS